MIAAFETNANAEFAERLLSAHEAGELSGAEEGTIHSAGPKVLKQLIWSTVDLRVDWHRKPIQGLRRILSVFTPQKQDYLTRALDPTAAPSHDVPGNP